MTHEQPDDPSNPQLAAIKAALLPCLSARPGCCDGRASRPTAWAPTPSRRSPAASVNGRSLPCRSPSPSRPCANTPAGTGSCACAACWACSPLPHGVAHLMSPRGLDQFFDWPAIAKDILKRPFITVGFAALVLMIPLAAQSPPATSRSAGSAGASGSRCTGRSTHLDARLPAFWWLVKKDITEPPLCLFGDQASARCWAADVVARTGARRQPAPTCPRPQVQGARSSRSSQ